MHIMCFHFTNNLIIIIILSKFIVGYFQISFLSSGTGKLILFSHQLYCFEFLKDSLEPHSCSSY